MEVVVDKLIDFSSGKDEELRDISTLGMLGSFSFFSPGLDAQKHLRRLLLSYHRMAKSLSLLAVS